MKIAIVIAAAVMLSGCQSVLKDLQSCERHYNGTVSGGTIQPAVLSGDALIDCCPVNFVASTDHKGCIPNPNESAGAAAPAPAKSNP